MSGLGTLLRLNATRDRVRGPIWVLALAALVAYFANVVGAVLETGGLEAMTGLIKTPTMALMGGPAYGFEHVTIPRFVVGVYGMYVMIGAALMSVFTVSRHTRATEADGTAEMLRAGAVSRHAQLAAAIITSVAMNVVLALLIIPILHFANIDPSPDLGSSALFAASVAAVGLTFTGIGALTSQLSATTRATSGIAGAILGASFILRGLGDMSRAQEGDLEWLAWLSPLGWGQRTAPFTLDRWWPLALNVGLGILFLTWALAIQSRRDLGAGVLGERLGSPQADGWMASPLALAFRLQRGSLVAWSAALAIAGIVFGAFTKSIADSADGLPAPVLSVMGGADGIVEGYAGFMGIYFAMIISAFALTSLSSLRHQEASSRTEHVLALAVGKPRWMLSWLAVTVLGSLWLAALSGFVHAIGVGSSLGDWELTGDIVSGHCIQVVAVLVFLAIGSLLYGAAPRALPLMWLPLIVSALITLFGRALQFDQAVMDVSPFEQIGQLPGAGIEWEGAIILMLAAVVVATIGVAAFRRRDLSAH